MSKEQPKKNNITPLDKQRAEKFSRVYLLSLLLLISILFFNLIKIFLVTILLALLGVYAMYSVKQYFGMERAAGADHFDPRYRGVRFVTGGIFRFTSNGMYVYAFLLFWAIAVGFNSIGALTVAAFSHAYIWVHFYATEKPDMDFLYAPDGSPSDS